MKMDERQRRGPWAVDRGPKEPEPRGQWSVVSGQKGQRQVLARMALAIVFVAAGAAAAEWRTVTAPLELAFPRDHGAHLEYRTEWWYVTGTLAAADGRRIGVQLTFFRRGIDPAEPRPEASGMAARQVLAAHLAIADERGGRLRFAERTRRVAAGLAVCSDTDLAVRVETWRLERLADGTLHATADDPAAGIGVELVMAPETALVANGDGGVSAKGAEPGNASAYLTWPRLRTSGRVRIGGEALAVTGASWLDHEWGSSQLGANVVGWDWLGVRLADGRALMAFRLRSGGSVDTASAGTLVGADGGVRRLAAADLAIEPAGAWTSPRTGAAYPARLRVRVPSAALDLELRPWLADAEIDARASTGVVYWEGPVAVSGSAAGEGYLELTGYAAAMTGRF
jgi:predicted secreted hydrolase